MTKIKLGLNKELETEYRSCPFCNGKAKLKLCDCSGSFYGELGTTYKLGRRLTHFLIKCEKCGVRTKAYATLNGVVNAWNRRNGGDKQ